MDRIGQSTVPNNQANEDFLFSYQFGTVQLLVVGDFAQSEFEPIDAATTNALQLLTTDNSVIEAAGKSIPLLLSQLATKLNARLLGFAEKYQARFQSVAMFAAIEGADLFYLPVGDCRLSVYTGKSLLLLNGSIWVDSYGNRLPMLVEPGQEVSKGSEAGPDQALGISPDLNVSTDLVRHCPLNKSDLVLLYSDGVDKSVSPIRLLQLIQGHASDATIQALSDKIIEEVRLEHGNDDRTLIIFAGPHVKQEDEARAESLHEIQKMSASIGGALDRISALLESNSTRLKTSVDNVSAQINQLPTLDQLRSISAGSDGMSRPSLKAILQKLGDIQNGIKSIENSMAGNGGDQSSNKGKQQKKESSKSSPPPEPTPHDSALHSGNEVPELGRINLNLPFREGVVRITTGFYELVDETSVEVSRGSGAISLVPQKWITPGWLTAVYLHLRLDPEPPKENETADSVKEWIQGRIEKAGKAVANVSPETLESLRNEHWRLRDKRRGIQRLWLTDNRLIEREKQLAAKVFRPYESATPVKAGHHAFNPPKSKEEKLFKYVIIALIVLAVIIIPTAVYTIWFSQGATTTTTTRQVNSSTTLDPITLDYGAEGRTLLAVQRGRQTEIGEYRIRIGDEQAFRRAFPQQQFSSREELIKTIEDKAGLFVARSNEPDAVDSSWQVFQMEAGDVYNLPATGNEKCTRFLMRVNQKLRLPRRALNALKDLQDLNPGLKCGELKVGDRLVVYSSPTR